MFTSNEGKSSLGGDHLQRVIWFDLGYTLVYWNREELYREHLQQLGIEKSIDELLLAYHLTDKHFMKHFPGLLGKDRSHWEEPYYRMINRCLQIDENTELLTSKQERKGRPEWRAFEAAHSTLAQLKKEGCQIGLISNWNLTAREVLENTGIMPYLDYVVISSEVDIEKPDERIFRHALELAGVQASQCLMVGDNYYDDIIGCRQVGMEGILINPYAKQGIEEINDVEVISTIHDLTALVVGGKT